MRDLWRRWQQRCCFFSGRAKGTSYKWVPAAPPIGDPLPLASPQTLCWREAASVALRLANICASEDGSGLDSLERSVAPSGWSAAIPSACRDVQRAEARVTHFTKCVDGICAWQTWRAQFDRSLLRAPDRPLWQQLSVIAHAAAQHLARQGGRASRDPIRSWLSEGQLRYTRVINGWTPTLCTSGAVDATIEGFAVDAASGQACEESIFLSDSVDGDLAPVHAASQREWYDVSDGGRPCNAQEEAEHEALSWAAHGVAAVRRVGQPTWVNIYSHSMFHESTMPCVRFRLRAALGGTASITCVAASRHHRANQPCAVFHVG